MNSDDESERLSRYCELSLKAKLKAEEEIYLKIERYKIKLRRNPNIPDNQYDLLESLEQELKEKNKTLDNKYAGFITINPQVNDPTIIDELLKLCEKCVSKYWVSEYAYVIEQRSAVQTDISGIHAHLLITRSIKPSHFEREVRSTFKKLVQIPQKHIHISWKRKEWINDKLDYMRGNKTGEGKDLKTDVDTYMRELYNIDPMYLSTAAFEL
ncbi:MAG: putative replicase [Circoviridae sp.]|nr:MAG: putative replicase [Circoviridae sp.]